MLYINADDWGASETTTNLIQECIDRNVVDSISAMVFMNDSERAADKVLSSGLAAALHINFTTPFNGYSGAGRLIESQQKIVNYLRSSKIAPYIYNPLLKNEFEYVFNAQCEEYFKLYQCVPGRIDGHNHMHLCANMLISDLLPHNIWVRRNNSFFKGEKNKLNKGYRFMIDKLLQKRYLCSDYFFHIQQISNKTGHNRLEKLQNIISLSKEYTVELLAHPHQKNDWDYLNCSEFKEAIQEAPRGNFDLTLIV
ncbi:ChbG/HpnK family deacetylase [Chitinispirillales bacterium ANBcel5]|uniref:ChbG/HpnK family deacetylase n=1 Tax=Cellulosispirillum alkaliphilum TaxID=3039283 RepID=UPI002A55A253|nr:ChbG/HpnK family deacetylase [Chitinispirillales bacterium ANBcel5]